ncbi:MAG: LCP family protein [Eubacterium sp.]|nr:LCP family protein [Eubacterium sp.]
MKIFKNRGDIYFPKSTYKSSKETQILRVLLVFIVIFTVAFIVFLSQHYSSAADFFGKGEITVTENEVQEEILPEIEGKTNFLVFETDEDKTAINFIFLVQADKTNKAYKVCSLFRGMKIDGKSLYDIYSTGGGASLQTKLTEYLGIQIDYFAEFDTTSFNNFVTKLGTFIYPISEDIKFTGGKGDNKYTVHLNEGEQKIDAQTLSNLIRYYSDEKKNYSAENEIILYSLTRLFNADNYEDCDSLFRLFIKSATTNVTVRNFENNKNALMVFCKANTSITLYSADTKYEGKTITQDSVKEIKGYFSK